VVVALALGITIAIRAAADNARQDSANAHRQALGVAAFRSMDEVLDAQLALPLDRRSRALVESSARVGTDGTGSTYGVALPVVRVEVVSWTAHMIITRLTVSADGDTGYTYSKRWSEDGVNGSDICTPGPGAPDGDPDCTRWVAAPHP
jgi:hypothetical protein